MKAKKKINRTGCSVEAAHTSVDAQSTPTSPADQRPETGSIGGLKKNATNLPTPSPPASVNLGKRGEKAARN